MKLRSSPPGTAPDVALLSTPEEIVWRLHLAASPETVFDFWANDAGRRRFWCEESRQEGKRIAMRFPNGVETETQITASDRPARLGFRYFESDVAIELAPDGKGGTDLTLRNRGVPANDYEEVLAGWLNVLFPLKAAADFGVDLRNHDPERNWDAGYADQ